MLKARLGNEFGNPASHEYQQREEAFGEYNALLEHSPEQVARVMATLAMGEDVNYDDKLNKKIYLSSQRILDATNNGTQIGVSAPTREAAWAEVFDDNGHKQAVREYAQFDKKELQTPQAIEARRQRGLQALKVIALTHLSQEERRHITYTPTDSREIFAA